MEQLLPLPFPKGGEGGKKCSGQAYILVVATPIFLLPNVFSRFEEMHINIAIAIQQRDKTFYLHLCLYKLIFNFN